MTKRAYLSDRQWRELFEAQGCRCCVAGCESEGPFEAEHSTPVSFGQAKPDQIMCVAHHKEKTRADKRNIAKAKRLSGETSSQWSRRNDGSSKQWGYRPLSNKRARTREQIMGTNNGR